MSFMIREYMFIYTGINIFKLMPITKFVYRMNFFKYRQDL